MKSMKAVTCISFFVIFICAPLHKVVVHGKKHETRLLDFLLKDYDIRSRPVEVYHSSLTINFSISFRQLLQVDEKHQTITTNVWRRMQWIDDSLKWNPESYGNISQLVVGRDKIWSPDIQLYNTASYDKQVESSTLSIVFNNGIVLEVFPMIIKSSCKMDVTWFPFDEQKCLLMFGSWTLSTKYLRMHIINDSVETLGFTELIDNGEWKFLDVTAEERHRFYECCPNESYVSVIYTIHLSRQPFYYFFNLLIPCGLIGFLAVLGFSLPPDSGEKLPLGVTILFSLIVFLNMIGETMPANSDAVPLLGTYFNCVMFMIALSVVSTIVINLNLKAFNIKSLHGRSKNIFLYLLPRILRMNLPSQKVFHQSLVATSNKEIGDDDSSDIKRFDEVNRVAQVELQWKFVAYVVDRLCFIISLIFTLISVIVFLIYAF